MLGNPLLKSQNLVSQVKATEFSRPAGFYKSIFVDFAGIVFALLTGLAYNLYLQKTIPLWMVLVVAGLFMTASMIGALMMQNPFRRAWVLLAATAGLLAFFYELPVVNLLILGVLVYFFFLWGDVSTHRELQGTVEVRFMRVTRPQIRKLTTALILAGIALYLPQWTPEGGFLPRDSFEDVFTWSAGMAARFYPGVRFNATVDAFLRDAASYKLEQDAEYAQLPPVAQEQAVAKSTTELTQVFQGATGDGFRPGERMVDFAHRAIVKLLDEWNKAFGSNLLIAWGIIAYLVLRSIGAVYYTIVGFFAFIVFQLLLATNFVMIIGETKVQQTVQYT